MKTTIFSKIKKLPLVIKLMAIVFIAVMLPLVGSVQANTSLMEGHVKSLNVTKGQTTYQPKTSASVDDVVQVQLWHHNRNNPKGEKVNNTVVKFNVPNQQGKNQVITGTSSSDNGNKIEGSTTIDLSMERAKVDYIVGSAKYRYNKGAAEGDATCKTDFDYPPARCYATVPISDEVVNGGVNLDKIRGGPLTGCNAYHETVIIQVRVKADVVSVNKFVRREGGDTKDWKTSLTVSPGEKIEYMIRFKNEGNTKLNQVMVGDNLPRYNAYVNGTTKLANSNYPQGKLLDNDNITKGGINVGNYNPGAVGLVWFTVKIDEKQAYNKCGTYDVRNVGIVQPEGMVEYYNTAQVKINVECEKKEPTFRCEAAEIKQLGDRKISVKVKPAYSGDVKVVNYAYDFGDGSDVLITDKDNVEHTFDKDGTFHIVAKINFNVNGEDKKDISSENCQGNVTFESGKPVVPPTKPEILATVDKPITTTPGTPSALPSTGPGDIVGIFAAVTIAGAMAHRLILARRS